MFQWSCISARKYALMQARVLASPAVPCYLRVSVRGATTANEENANSLLRNREKGTRTVKERGRERKREHDNLVPAWHLSLCPLICARLWSSTCYPDRLNGVRDAAYIKSSLHLTNELEPTLQSKERTWIIFIIRCLTIQRRNVFY